MVINLQKICPVYFEPEKLNHSEIWNQEISFQQKDYIQIVAPSGRGKTSFIHFLYGLRNDYEGSIQLNETPLKNMNAEALATVRSRQIAIQFQDLRLFANHTGRQNIQVKKDLAAYQNSMSVIDMAKHLGVANKLDQPVKTCSYGEQQRISLIRCLQQPFQFLLLDEPFGHLDEQNRHKAMELIQFQAAERNAGIILADLEILPYYKAHKILHL